MKTSIFKNSQDFRKSLEARLQKTAKEKGIEPYSILAEECGVEKNLSLAF